MNECLVITIKAFGIPSSYGVGALTKKNVVNLKMDENKKNDKFDTFSIISNLFYYVYTFFCLFYFFVIANRLGPMLKQYEDFAEDCISVGLIFGFFVFNFLPRLVRKLKNAAPKGEKGRKEINGTDNIDRI